MAVETGTRSHILPSVAGSAVGAYLTYTVASLVADVLDLERRSGWLREMEGALTTAAAGFVAVGIAAGCALAIRLTRGTEAATTAVGTVGATAVIAFIVVSVGPDRIEAPLLIGIVAVAAALTRLAVERHEGRSTGV